MAFHIIREDITKVKADVIVNTANPEVAIGDGVDFAIYQAAGKEELFLARKEIGSLKVGEVGITPAFHLDAKYIIHSIGPYWVDGLHQEKELLRQCYDKSLALADQYNCESIAFPLMATGSYGFPKEIGLKIALEAFQEFLLQHEMEIILVVFEETAYRVSGKIFENVRAYVENSYIEQRLQEEYHGDSSSRLVEIPDYFSSSPRSIQETIEEDVVYCSDDDVEDSSNVLETEIFTSISTKKENKKHLGMFSLSTQSSSNRKFAKCDSTEEEMKERSCFSNTSTMHQKLDSYMQQEQGSFGEYLQQLIRKRGMKNSQVYTAANLTKQYFSKLMNGKVTPSKTKILSLAIALQLNMDETVDFLRMSGYAFSPSSSVDKIFQYFIHNKIYDIYRIDIILFDYGLPTLANQ